MNFSFVFTGNFGVLFKLNQFDNIRMGKILYENALFQKAITAVIFWSEGNFNCIELVFRWTKINLSLAASWKGKLNAILIDLHNFR